jgi:hypothetical protein
MRKKFFASIELFLHILSVKLDELHVIPLLSITEELVVQLAVLSRKAARFDDLLIEDRPNTAMLRESAPLFEQQSADRIEQGVIGTVDSKGIGACLYSR